MIPRADDIGKYAATKVFEDQKAEPSVLNAPDVDGEPVASKH